MLDGTVTITEASSEPQTYGPGDAFVIRRGTVCDFDATGALPQDLHVVRTAIVNDRAATSVASPPPPKLGSTGLAIQDLAIARATYETATELDLGALRL